MFKQLPLQNHWTNWRGMSNLGNGVIFVFINEPFYLKTWIIVILTGVVVACLLLVKCFSVALAMLLMGFLFMMINFHFLWSDLNTGFLLRDLTFYRLNYLKKILDAYWFSFKLFFKYPLLWAKLDHLVYTIHYLFRI